MVMLKIGTSDYSNRVIAGSYSINSKEVYKSWNDLNGVEHRDIIRYRTTGSFDMYFPTIAEYEAFNDVLEANRNQDMSVKMAVCDNRTNKVIVKDFYYSFQLTRNRDGSWNDIYERFKVNIQER